MGLKKSAITALLKTVVSTDATRKLASKQFEKMLHKRIIENGNPKYSDNARIYIFNSMRAMFSSSINNIDRGYISKEVAKKIIDTLVDTAMLQGEERQKALEAYEKKYGTKPPSFFTLSPTKKCNLKCTGCYASSKIEAAETLDWDIVEKIMEECHDEMGMRFFVISGGEPLLYKSKGKTIFDIIEKYPDSFFLMYTNSTLITKEVAERMAKAGNITPAISVEGFEEQTDERRGKGVHKRILGAMDNLKKAGVPFGVSVTATNKNIKILQSDEFYDEYFKNLGASHMWMFHYMPIGRKYTTQLMLNPKERLDLFKHLEKVVENKRYFVADFWNSAMLSDGCLSCAKHGGYFYIDWNGNIMPCVFIPYYKHNAGKLLAEGKKIRDALFSEMFVEGRKWQEEYLNKDGKMGNMLMPCFIRDHHKKFLKIARDAEVLPEDEAAKEAMEDEEYHEELEKFDKELKEVSEAYWEEKFAKKD